MGMGMDMGMGIGMGIGMGMGMDTVQVCAREARLINALSASILLLKSSDAGSMVAAIEHAWPIT